MHWVRGITALKKLNVALYSGRKAVFQKISGFVTRSEHSNSICICEMLFVLAATCADEPPVPLLFLIVYFFFCLFVFDGWYAA